MEAGFDHPCKQTCSGWEQGRQRGRLESDEIQQRQIDALSNPEWVRSLLLRFSGLSQSRQMLFLELMREMSGKNE